MKSATVQVSKGKDLQSGDPLLHVRATPFNLTFDVGTLLIQNLKFSFVRLLLTAVLVELLVLFLLVVRKPRTLFGNLLFDCQLNCDLLYNSKI
jgi:hypothetical protein